MRRAAKILIGAGLVALVAGVVAALFPVPLTTVEEKRRAWRR